MIDFELAVVVLGLPLLVPQAALSPATAIKATRAQVRLLKMR